MSVGIASTSVYFWGDGSSSGFNGQSGKHLRGLYTLVEPISMGQTFGYYVDGLSLYKSTGVGTAVNGISTVAYYVYNSEANSGAGQTALFVQDYNGSGHYYAWKIVHNFSNGVGLNTDVFPTTVEAEGEFTSDISPAGYYGFYGSVQAIDPTGNFTQNQNQRWDGTTDVVIWDGDGSVNNIGIFTALTGYGVDPGNSAGVAASTGQTYWQMAADAENDYGSSVDEAGFFWDSFNNQWQWMDDVNPPTDVTSNNTKSDGSWGSISTLPQGDSSFSGNVVYLSLATLGYTEQSEQQQEQGGGGQVTAPTLKLKRGLQADLPILSVGEPGFTTDSYQLYVGSPSGNKLIGGNDFFSLEGTTTGGGINLYEGTDNGTDFIQLRAPDSLSGITTYTMPAGANSGFMKITSSSSSNNDYEISLGFASVLENLRDDTFPQLGGNLDLNGNSITGVATFTSNVVVEGTSFSGLSDNVDNLVTLSGVSSDSTDLGTFTGSTISDNVTIKTALQDLETQLDSVAGGGAHATSVAVGATDTDATHYLTFVDSNNASRTQEIIETDAGLSYNPSTNVLTAGGVNMTTLSLNGADVTATAAEINVLDGVTAGTATTTKALVVDDYGNLTNLGVVTATTFSGELDSTSITLAGLAVTAILDEDDLVSNRADALATQQSIKAYVDAEVGAVVSSFDIAADSGSNDTVSTGQTITFTGSANEIITTVTNNQIEIGLRDTVNITTELDVPTIEVGSIEARDGTTAITITNSTGAVSIANSMTISGDLFVNGTTTEVNSTQLTVEDTIIELQLVDGGELTGDTNKDVGMIFNYYDTAAKKAAVFWDDSTSRVAFGASITESSGVITVPDTQWAAIEAKELYISDSVGIASAIITTSGSDRVLQSVLIDCGSF